MRVFEYQCQKCRAVIELSDEECTHCPNCGSTKLKVRFYEELSLRQLLFRMADLEARIGNLEELWEKDDSSH